MEKIKIFLKSIKWLEVLLWVPFIGLIIDVIYNPTKDITNAYKFWGSLIWQAVSIIGIYSYVVYMLYG